MKNDKKQKLLASLSDFAKNFPVFLERLPFYILIAFYIFILACRTYISFASGEFMSIIMSIGRQFSDLFNYMYMASL